LIPRHFEAAMFNRILFAAVTLLCLSIAPLTQALAQQAAQPTPDDRARQWLTLLDNANYAQAWSDAAPAFHTSHKADGWPDTAAKLRQPLGAMASRDLHDVKMSANNHSATVRYDSVFAQKPRALETVTLQLGSAGWSVTGYTVE
jgi:hypothetical protein